MAVGAADQKLRGATFRGERSIEAGRRAGHASARPERRGEVEVADVAVIEPWKPVWPVAKLVLMVLELPLVRPFTPPPRPYETHTTIETKSRRELVEHLANPRVQA